MIFLSFFFLLSTLTGLYYFTHHFLPFFHPENKKIFEFLILVICCSIEYVDQAITWLKSLASSAPAQVNQPAVELSITEHMAKMVNIMIYVYICR